MQMKKRVLSAFMALCMVCSLVGAAWAVIPQVSAAVNGVTIVDSIKTDGRFTARLNGNLSSGQTAVYTWARSSNGYDYEEIAYTKVTGDLYNMAGENGTSEATWVNVALDSEVANAADSQRYWYQVTVQILNSDGNAVDEPYTAAAQVPYYVQLQNGSFETPAYDDHGQNYVMSGTDGVVWQTTGYYEEYGSRIELVGDNTYTWHGVNYCPTDDIYETSVQCAELNADSAGALYQDVLTTPGSTMYWSLMHNGRTRNNSFVGHGNYSQNHPASDTMYVLIMSATMADEMEINTQEDVEAAIEAIQEGDPKYAGATVDTIEYKWYWTRENNGSPWRPNYTYYLHVYDEATDQWIKYEPGDNGQVQTVWKYHTGEYKVPSNQYLTRYFFVAGETELGRNTGDDTPPYSVGNHIDNVHFSTDLPPAAPGTVSLEIEKHITGDLTETDFGVLKNQLKFTVQYGSQSVTVNGSDMTWTGADGKYTGTYVIQNISLAANESLQYTITEDASSAQMTGYTLEASMANNSGSLLDGQVGVASFTNTYQQLDPLSPEHNKYIKDNGDGTYDLSLNVKGEVQTESETIPINVLYVLDTSYSMIWDMDGTYAPGEDGDEDLQHNSFERMKAAQDAMDALNRALQDEKFDPRFAMVTFNKTATTRTDTWISDSDGLFRAGITAETATTEQYGSGTNYEAAFNEALPLIQTAPTSGDRSNAQTIVIFISDGQPNWPRPNENEDLAYAQSQAEVAAKLISCDQFYAIGVGENGEGEEYRSNLQGVVNAVTADETDLFVAKESEALVDYFESLRANFTSVDCTNVVITDQLSYYAELVDESQAPTITIQPLTGQPIQVAITNYVQGNDGIYTGIGTFNDGDGVSQPLTYTYNPGTKTFTLEFPSTYALENGWTYTITVKIQPTEDAYQYYATNNSYPTENGETTKGEEGTDAPGNDTSSGKPGFYSNADADLTYKSNGVDAEQPYPDPVIQVKLGDLVIDKNVSGVDTSVVADKSFTFNIERLSEDGSTVDATFNGIYDGVTFTSGVAQVTITGDDAEEISGLLMGNYRVTENDPGNLNAYDHTGTTYQVGEDTTQDVTVSPAKTSTITVTNTYALRTHILTVTKHVDGNMGDTTQDFEFTITGLDAGAEYTIQNADGSQTTGTLGQDHTFTLKSGQSAIFTGLNELTDYSVTETNVPGYDQLVVFRENTDSNGGTIQNKGEDQSASWIVDADSEHPLIGDVSILFTNTRNVGTPTGFFEDNLPFTLMISAAGLAGIALIAAILVRRQRRRRE